MILLWCIFLRHFVMAILPVFYNLIKGVFHISSDTSFKRWFEFCEDKLNSELIQLSDHLMQIFLQVYFVYMVKLFDW